MNKDTIYIEPEDDITDIITKIENSKEKIVALVPPKKAGVFRSVVNIKLIAKAGKSSEKNVVLVTMDPSITKLAAASKLPVAKNLQSAPAIPSLDSEVEETSVEDVDENGKTETPPEEAEPADDESDKTEDESEEGTDDTEDESEDNEDSEEEDAEAEKPKKKAKKSKASGNKFMAWIRDHKKLSIMIAVLLVGLIGFLIWALFFAPAVDMVVSIKTETNNFSESLTFVKEQSQENIAEGKIYLEERKIETVNEVAFEATGQKNIGEKASGTLTVSHSFFVGGSIPVNQGTVFTIDGLNFVATESVPLGWGGWSGTTASDIKKSVENCTNSATAYDDEYCTIVREVKVVAANAGTAYNIPAKTGWSTIVNVDVSSNAPMSGGTDNIITVVQQSDVEKARNGLSSANEEENKEKLYASIPEDSLILESTYNQTTSSATSTPAVDEEVKEGVKPTLKTTTTTSVYIIDKTKLEELIKAKVKLGDEQKIFEIRDVYIDGFKELESGFTGKLKAQYFTGPKITESEVVEKVKGRGLGDAQRVLRDIDGITEVKLNPSYPWVFAVPTDSNRITVHFEIRDQNGQQIEEKSEEEKSEDAGDDQKKSSESEKEKSEN